MRVLLQRVKQASVEIDGNVNGEIGQGILVLVGFTENDADKEIEYLARKVLNATIFSDADDKINEKLRESGVQVETGIFGADMQVSLVNDGPVTIMYDTDEE